MPRYILIHTQKLRNQKKDKSQRMVLEESFLTFKP